MTVFILCSSVTMLGHTEACFNTIEDEEYEEEKDNNNKRRIPFNILRQESTHNDKKRQLSQEHRAAVCGKETLNTPTETNRLETGPPAAKRCRTAAQTAQTPKATVTRGQCFYNMLY